MYIVDITERVVFFDVHIFLQSVMKTKNLMRKVNSTPISLDENFICYFKNIFSLFPMFNLKT